MRILNLLYWTVVLLLTVLLIVMGAHAQPIPAIAHLGLCKYSGVAARAHPRGFGMVVFTNTFCPDSRKEIREVLDTGKVPFIEYNLKWSDTHTFTTKDFTSIVDEAKRYARLTERYPNIACAFSGATEHQLSRRDANELAKQVLAVIPPRCVYVNNPWGRGSFIDSSDRVWNEFHGEIPKNIPAGNIIFGWDGLDAFDDPKVQDKKNKLKHAKVLAYWTSQNNGRRNRNDTTPRKDRTFWPTFELIQALGFLHTDQGTVKVPTTFTIKPKSDQHKVPPASRELKPVFILPHRARFLELRVGDKSIIKSGEAEPFADGRWRYYFPKFGYEIVKDARTNVLDLYISGPGGRKQGTVNPAFRQ